MSAPATIGAFARGRRAPPAPVRPGLRHGPTPARRLVERRRTALDRFAVGLLERLGERRRARALRERSVSLAGAVAELGARSDAERTAALVRLRARLACRGHDESTVVEALAHAAHAAERALGLVPREGQRLAATALLEGRFVEMPTGEGKTLATALAAAAAALDGTPVHVMTANDYLAERDARRLAPLYAALGLSVGCVLPSMDETARRAAYARDIVHLTGKQAGFDWMRDALALGPEPGALVERLGELTRAGARRATAPNPLQRGLCMAIVDEADSLLVDEARTPLVLAAALESGDRLERDGIAALALARMLREGSDYRVSRAAREVTLSETGAAALARLAERVPGSWQATRYRDERVRQALAALHLWHRDRDYVVSEGRVVLVDEHSGRPLADRRLQRGLHGLLELKEGCRVTPASDTAAAIGFQRFFGRYHRLVGTSGTLREVRGELARVYGAALVTVSPERPVRRRVDRPRVFATRASQLETLLEEVRRCRETGRAALVGTGSVEQSRGVGALLAAHGIPHRVLDARQDDDEAAIVAEAGEAGQVTVATNMAGRGTDIPLGEGVAERGGLHVVSLAFNHARRIDRQLAGRSARRGEPGSFRRLWSLDDPALDGTVPAVVLETVRATLAHERLAAAGERLALVLLRLAQRCLERRYARERHLALAARERIDHHVAVGGHPEHPA